MAKRGRKPLGIWKKIARGDAGHKKAQADLAAARYFLQMTSWLLTKLINHSEFSRFQGRPSELDDICFEKIHASMRMCIDAARNIEFVCNCSELAADEYSPEDKVVFDGIADSGPAKEAETEQEEDEITKEA